MYKLCARINKERFVLLFVLLQDNDTGGDADSEKEVLRQLYHAVHKIVVYQVAAYLLFRSAAVQHTRELDDSRRAAAAEPMEDMHRKGEVCLALGSQYTCGRETFVVDKERVAVARPTDGVGRVGDDDIKRLVVPVLRFLEGVAEGDVELLVVDVVEKHIDTA